MNARIKAPLDIRTLMMRPLSPADSELDLEIYAVSDKAIRMSTSMLMENLSLATTQKVGSL